MDKTATWRTVSVSPAATELLGEQIGATLRGGEVIELVSDLGGGKTTFVRGLARGLGSGDKVASPTFTISRQYTAGGLTLHHFDFYRLTEPGIVADELAEVAADPQAIVVVEWATIAAAALPPDKVTIVFTPTTEESREIAITYPASRDYLIQRNTSRAHTKHSD